MPVEAMSEKKLSVDKRQSRQCVSLIHRVSARNLLAFILVTSLSIGIVSHSTTQAADEDATQARLGQVRAGIAKLKDFVSDTTTKRSKTEQALKTIEVEIADTSKKLRKVNTDIQAGSNKLKSLKQEKAELQLALRGQQSALTADIRSAYMQGRQERVKLLLNQEQPEKLARTLRYYDYFHQSRSKRINEFTETILKIQQIEVSINDKSIELGQLKDRLVSQKRQFEKAQKQRKAVISKLDSELRGTGSQLSKLLADEQELQTLLEAVQQTLDDLPPDIGQVAFTSRKGKLAWPAKGSVRNSFGAQKQDSRLRWKGILIGAAAGSDVRAVHHGRVVFAEWLRGVGLLMILDHGDGYFSLYGHNQSLLKESGDWVRTGEVIASVGNSGGQSKSGLYFEIRAAGKPTNPSQWIARK